MKNKIRLAPGNVIWCNVDGFMCSDRLHQDTTGDVLVILTGNVEKLTTHYFQVITPNGLGWVRKDFLRETR